MALKKKGSYASTAKTKSETHADVESDESTSVSDDVKSSKDSSKNVIRTSSLVIFAAIAFLLTAVASGALVPMIGVMFANIENVNGETNMLDMLNAWFFPMLTFSIVFALLIVGALRRILHKIENRRAR